MDTVKTQETQKTQEIYEQLAVTSQRVFPTAPYPRKYVHCVFENVEDVVMAVQSLQSVGCNINDIHLMSGWDFSTAIEQRYMQQSGLFQALTHMFFDYDFDNMYLHEARRGHHILSVRPSGFEQITKVRDALAAHHARLMKYIDTWTMAELVP